MTSPVSAARSVLAPASLSRKQDSPASSSSPEAIASTAMTSRLGSVAAFCTIRAHLNLSIYIDN
jgi:hypothetical protein